MAQQVRHAPSQAADEVWTEGRGRTVTMIICLDAILDAAPASAPAAARRGERCQLDRDRRRRTLPRNNEDVVEEGESPEIMRLLPQRPCHAGIGLRKTTNMCGGHG